MTQATKIADHYDIGRNKAFKEIGNTIICVPRYVSPMYTYDQFYITSHKNTFVAHYKIQSHLAIQTTDIYIYRSK